jgi:nicotinamidase-related amidase
MTPKFELANRQSYKEGMKSLLSIDPTRTVVLTVDMQYNYLEADAGGDPILPDEAARVLRGTKRLIDFAQKQSIPVIHVYTTRREKELEINPLPFSVGRIGRSVKLWQTPHTSQGELPDRPEGSHRSQVPSELVSPQDLHVTTKKTMDGYLYSDLDWILSYHLKPETVVLTGINTDTCVYSTAFSTANRGYQPVVISDCVASMRGKDSHLMALELMARSIAWVLTVEEFKEKIQAAGPATTK